MTERFYVTALTGWPIQNPPTWLSKQTPTTSFQVHDRVMNCRVVKSWPPSTATSAAKRLAHAESHCADLNATMGYGTY